MPATIEPATPKPRIFVSYATLDRIKALRIVDALEKLGHPCWIAPRDIPAGHDFQAEIVIAIESAAAVVLLLSKNATASTEIPKEISVARESRRLIMPVRLDEAELGPALRYQITSAQWIDLSKNFDGGITELAERLTRQIDPVRAAEEAARRNRRPLPRGVGPALVFAALALATFYAWPLFRPSLEALIAARVRQPLPGQVAPPAFSPVAPPQAPDSPERRVQAFVESYYSALSGPPARVIQFVEKNVADPVELYGRSLPRRVLVAQEGAYLQRWPERQFVIEPGSFQVSCKPARCATSGLIDYTMRTPARHVSEGTERFEVQVGTAPLSLLSISTTPVEKRKSAQP